jgi:hypothetical protein
LGLEIEMKVSTSLKNQRQDELHLKVKKYKIKKVNKEKFLSFQVLGESP